MPIHSRLLWLFCCIQHDTRMQLELINQTLAELQAQKALADKPRNPIGFITPKKK
mgnify:CR=1 FL=1